MGYFLVMDTSSFVRLFSNLEILEQWRKKYGEFQIVLSTLILNELKDNVSKLIFDGFNNLITVLEAKRKYMRKVEKLASEYGGKQVLSKADVSVLAIALELRERYNRGVIIITEDYDIQNLSEALSIEYSSVQGKKIKRVLIFYKKCKACGRVYSGDLDSCPDCGSREFEIIVRKSKKL